MIEVSCVEQDPDFAGRRARQKGGRGQVIAPPWASPALEKRLLGSWEGSGQVSGDLSFDIPPGQKVPSGRAAQRVTTCCAVRAEFGADGTYTWEERHQGDGIAMWFSLPKEGDPHAGRWSARGGTS
jgi:hypothetical protein